MAIRIPPMCHVVHLSDDEQDRWSVDAYVTERDLKICYPYVDEPPASNSRRDKEEAKVYNQVARQINDDPFWIGLARDRVCRNVRRALVKERGENFVRKHPFDFENLRFVMYYQLYDMKYNRRPVEFSTCVQA